MHKNEEQPRGVSGLHDDNVGVLISELVADTSASAYICTMAYFMRDVFGYWIPRFVARWLSNMRLSAANDAAAVDVHA